jgi:hypothetical protein
VDIGNYRCGDTLVAMAPGVAYRVQDNATAYGAPSNALGVRIDHGHGVLSEIWHMSQWLVENGSPVNAGQAVGSVGNTGVSTGCHAHIEIKVNGIRINPEPLMFGQVLRDPEDDYLPYTITAEIHERWRTISGQPFFTIFGVQKHWTDPIEVVSSTCEIAFEGAGTRGGRLVNYNGEPLLVPRSSLTPTGERIDSMAVHRAVR